MKARLRQELLLTLGWLAPLAMFVLLPVLNAHATKSSQLVRGTVIAVQERRVQSPDFTTGGSNPSDAPLASRYYAFRIAIRVDCKIYIGRYETALNYLPSAFTAGRSVSMHLTKHVMYFDLPENPELRIGIVRREAACGPHANSICPGSQPQRN